MLNRNQRKFKREIKKVEKNESKYSDIYSYKNRKFLGETLAKPKNKVSRILVILRGIFFVCYGFLLTFCVIVTIFSSNALEMSIFLAIFLTGILLVFGALSPYLVFVKSRLRVFRIYGGITLLLCIILFFMTI